MAAHKLKFRGNLSCVRHNPQKNQKPAKQSSTQNWVVTTVFLVMTKS